MTCRIGFCIQSIVTLLATNRTVYFGETPKVLAKVAEYLDAGTTIVLVLDDPCRLAHLYRADGTTRLLGSDEELTIPDLLGDFHVRIGRFFE